MAKKQDGCTTCRGLGYRKLTCCPKELITPEVTELIASADWAQKGLPPVAGGLLNQCMSWVEGVEVYRAASAQCELEAIEQ